MSHGLLVKIVLIFFCFVFGDCREVVIQQKNYFLKNDQKGYSSVLSVWTDLV